MPSIERSEVLLDAKTNITKTWTELYENDNFTDVTLFVGDNRKKFRAHRLVLAVQSDIMARMLYGSLKESTSSEFCVSQCDPSPFEHFLRFSLHWIYQSTVVFN